ncbi:M28 family peptidase [Mangrovimonas sp. YM274]|uniref:M28 family metallopeptidase n=1 Tax=Mangrovimonas sp. YM274 TaxID=3070660 RepID=UPI0027DBDBC7|nr:M28 family peptidase [Mangrovimonas sp. YM274]WMI69659.1 M28 family peptidase [Mangrovimonas sp. YM274]
MNKIFALLALTVLYNCKQTDTPSSATKTEVSEMVAFLASDDLKGRNTGTPEINEAAKYIENKFKAYGVAPYFEGYQDEFVVDSLKGFNVVGVLEGNDPELKNEYVVLGAHYDHIGYGKKVDLDSIANGANDNASGSASVLAFAKHFAQTKSNKRSIMFVLFSGEEKGLLGSTHLAKRLKQQNFNLYTMINFEMLGVPLNNRDYEVFITGYKMSNVAEKLNAYHGNNLVGVSEIAEKHNLFKASDNYPFYQEFSLPCHTVSSCDLSNYDFYHKVGDEAQLMNYEFMASVINKFTPVIEAVCNTPTQEIKLN